MTGAQTRRQRRVTRPHRFCNISPEGSGVEGGKGAGRGVSAGFEGGGWFLSPRQSAGPEGDACLSVVGETEIRWGWGLPKVTVSPRPSWRPGLLGRPMIPCLRSLLVLGTQEMGEALCFLRKFL